jgi:hypothetical protein
LVGPGSGRPNWRQITTSILSCETSAPSTMISSPTMTAGATGRSSSKYSSVRYSSLGLDMVSILISYFSPSPGIIFLKCFHGLPLGSLKKNRNVSMFISIYFLVSFVPIFCSRVTNRKVVQPASYEPETARAA